MFQNNIGIGKHLAGRIQFHRCAHFLATGHNAGTLTIRACRILPLDRAKHFRARLHANMLRLIVVASMPIETFNPNCIIIKQVSLFMKQKRHEFLDTNQ
jgi:hypothetical protein